MSTVLQMTRHKITCTHIAPQRGTQKQPCTAGLPQLAAELPRSIHDSPPPGYYTVTINGYQITHFTNFILPGLYDFVCFVNNDDEFSAGCFGIIADAGRRGHTVKKEYNGIECCDARLCSFFPADANISAFAYVPDYLYMCHAVSVKNDSCMKWLLRQLPALLTLWLAQK
jgi:hypothetical protein